MLLQGEVDSRLRIRQSNNPTEGEGREGKTGSLIR